MKYVRTVDKDNVNPQKPNWKLSLSLNLHFFMMASQLLSFTKQHLESAHIWLLQTKRLIFYCPYWFLSSYKNKARSTWPTTHFLSQAKKKWTLDPQNTHTPEKELLQNRKIASFFKVQIIRTNILWKRKANALYKLTASF